MTGSKALALADIEGFLGGLFGEEVHAKRVQSLASATLGAMTAASLVVAAIGHGLALARGGLTKHAIKQVIGCCRTRGSPSTSCWRCGYPM